MPIHRDPFETRGASAGLSRRLLGAGVAVAAVVGLWFSPVSPLGLERGDVLVGVGDVEGAALHYARVGRFSPFAAQRHEARLRAAMLWSADAGQPERARDELRALAGDDDVPAPLRALAWERLAMLLGGPLDEPGEAASAWSAAHDAAPEAPAAASRLIEAARARGQSGDHDAAFKLWERVAKKYPQERALALVNQAAVMLGKGRMRSALNSYEEAIELAARRGQESVLQVARLGASTCKERLGAIEAALADAEAADLPEDVLRERSASLEGRAHTGTDL
jgi:tetratricopeptide (TPR) repeat protein